MLICSFLLIHIRESIEWDSIYVCDPTSINTQLIKSKCCYVCVDDYIFIMLRCFLGYFHETFVLSEDSENSSVVDFLFFSHRSGITGR